MRKRKETKTPDDRKRQVGINGQDKQVGWGGLLMKGCFMTYLNSKVDNGVERAYSFTPDQKRNVCVIFMYRACFIPREIKHFLINF